MLSETNNKPQRLKSTWWGIILIIVLLPIVLNFILQIPHFTPIVGNNETWLNFWVTYISAVASFAMVFITWRTLRQMKLQWNEEQRARLVFSIDAIQGIYVLKIRNVGKSDAYKICIKFNDNYIKCILANSIRETYEKLQTKAFFLEEEKTRYLYISNLYSSNSSTSTYGKQTFSNVDINN